MEDSHDEAHLRATGGGRARLAAFAGAAGAAPSPTPNGLTGALSMVNTNALAGDGEREVH